MRLLDLININFDSVNPSHLCIWNNRQVKYLIDFNYDNSKKSLLKNIQSYSIKHELFKKLLNVPNKVLLLNSNFKLVQINLSKELLIEINNIAEYYFINHSSLGCNYIIGTKGPHQKFVIQLFDKEKALFMKVGNEKTQKLIKNEALIYKQLNDLSTNFQTTKIIKYKEYDKFSMSCFDELNGYKLLPEFDQDIFRLCMEISNLKIKTLIRTCISDIKCEFSHGDLAPWNIRKNSKALTVFDWEYGGYRFAGYDVIHYIYQIETLLNNKEHDEAIKIAINSLKSLRGDLKNISNEIFARMYVDEVRRTLSLDSKL